MDSTHICTPKKRLQSRLIVDGMEQVATVFGDNDTIVGSNEIYVSTLEL